MLRSLGPRGDVGVNPIMRGHDLANLDLLVSLRAKEGPVRAQSRGDGTQWIIVCRPMGGRTRPNLKRRAAAK